MSVSHGVIPLVWNGMMSFGGGWFFLIASEVITVNNADYALPGIGSYVAAASADEQIGRLLLAIGVMVLMVVGVNFFFWRPLTAWAERFRVGDTVAPEQRSVVLAILRRSRLPVWTAAAARPVRTWLDRTTQVFGRADSLHGAEPARRRGGVVLDVLLAVVIGAALTFGLVQMIAYIDAGVGLGQVGVAAGLGLLTFGRVVVLVVVATLVWVPIGVWIGLDPRVTRIAQPIVQVLASFPANFLFPFVTVALVHTGVSLNVGGILLMALGSQWYILFNVIAGASAIPGDLREVATNLRLSRWQRWRTLYGPAVLTS